MASRYSSSVQVEELQHQCVWASLKKQAAANLLAAGRVLFENDEREEEMGAWCFKHHPPKPMLPTVLVFLNEAYDKV